MSALPPRPFRATTPGMRRMLFVASVLVFIVGVPLTLLTEHTDVYFAWTIKSSLTVAFLGAAYWSSGVLELLAARETLWSRARIAVPAVLIFTALTLVITLIHIDKFHFTSTNALTLVGTWVWLLVYALVPIALGVLLVLQLRALGGDPPRRALLPVWVRSTLALNAAVMLLLGVALLLTPLAAAGLWPWALTALSGRAVGAWLVGLGVSAGQAVWENDLQRTRVMLISSIVFAALQFVALARYPGEFAWSSPAGWVYLLFLADLLAVGVYGWWATQRLQSPVAPATA